MFSSIDPEVSSTSTISNGFVTFETPTSFCALDIAESPTRNESSCGVTVTSLWSYVSSVTGSVATDLSVHTRPVERGSVGSPMPCSHCVNVVGSAIRVSSACAGAATNTSAATVASAVNAARALRPWACTARMTVCVHVRLCCVNIAFPSACPRWKLWLQKSSTPPREGLLARPAPISRS